jgi:adenylate kinase
VRAVITGQVGLDKQALLSRAAELAREQGEELTVCNVGKMMYAEAPDVAPGRILDLPLSRLHSLRRSVFKDVLAACESKPNVAVNTHATFRWRHGLFHAFDYDQMQRLSADVYVVVVDSVDRVHWRLVRDGHADHTLKDLMVWREEEILATELLSEVVSAGSGGRGRRRFYIVARGADDSTVAALVRLLFRPELRKAYLSFPMSHVSGEQAAAALLAEIEAFRARMKQTFTCFDPGDVEEKQLCSLAIKAAEAGHRTVEAGPPGERAALETHQLLDIIPDVDGQIYARDFKLIDQSDMIVSLIPALPGGRPAISSGVERELQHAHEATREVFVIWRPDAEPSPFIPKTATRVFRSVDEAIAYFHELGYVPRPPAGTLFA